MDSSDELTEDEAARLRAAMKEVGPRELAEQLETTEATLYRLGCCGRVRRLTARQVRQFLANRVGVES